MFNSLIMDSKLQRSYSSIPSCWEAQGSSVPVLTLNNGQLMPQQGLGTFLIPKEKLSDTIAKAYDFGYRKLDTAWRYYNEKEIAKALKDHHILREKIFVTTKVNADALYLGRYHGGRYRYFNFRVKSIKKAIEESFSNLGFEYVDLFLVHTPWPVYPDMYEVLTDFYHQGRIRSIGVSSFLPPMIESLKEISDVVPAVNQFEISPLNTQKKLIQYCQDRGIVAEAMSTFSHFRSVEPRSEVIENLALLELAKKYSKSVVQVVLRWLVQQGVSIIPKTWDTRHLEENISIYDFALSDEDMAIIDSLDEGKFLNYNPYGLMYSIPKKFRDWEGFE